METYKEQKYIAHTLANTFSDYLLNNLCNIDCSYTCKCKKEATELAL